MNNVNFKIGFIRIIGLLLISLFLTVGCSSTKPQAKISKYDFKYEGEDYTIESIEHQNKEGYNVILKMNSANISIKAIDKEQDGVIDNVIFGNITLDRANLIYQNALSTASKSGDVKKRNFTRHFVIEDSVNRYILETYILSLGDTYNKLIIESLLIKSSKDIVLDNGANGTLDEIIDGTNTMQFYQKIYNRVLSNGTKANKIDGYKVCIK